MKKIIMTVIMLLLFCNVTHAADMLYRITHNDHDALIVGEITYIDDEKIKADVSKVIVSTAYMNQIDKSVQLNPATVTIDISNLRLDTEFNVGDYILASLDKTLIDFKIANGLFKVDSLDSNTLKIIYDGDDKPADIVALEYFINSNGVINEFSFEENTIKFVDPSGEEIELYTEEDDEETYNETLELEDETTLQKVLAKEYDDAMVVTILLTAGIMILIISIKYRTKVDD